MILLWLSCFTGALAQDKLSFVSASELTQLGQLLPVKNQFHRVDTAQFPALPKIVKHLLTQSAGKAVLFKTNSTTIGAKWCVSTKKQLVNLTPMAQKGLDLYIKKNGEWIFAGVGRPKQSCNNEIIVANMDSTEKECLLYLPLYDETFSLEVGVDEGSQIAGIKSPFKKRVLIYGSSITQGASASRPGMAYPALLSRATGIEFLNLGLSGSAKMEPEVADMVALIPADAYILDCVPNSSAVQITERTSYLVNAIQKKNPHAPVIIIQSMVREQGNFDTHSAEFVGSQNLAMQQQYEALVKRGVNNLYFIRETDFLGTDHEGTIDGTHPNDLGFNRFLQIIQPQILQILKAHHIAD